MKNYHATGPLQDGVISQDNTNIDEVSQDTLFAYADQFANVTIASGGDGTGEPAADIPLVELPPPTFQPPRNRIPPTIPIPALKAPDGDWSLVCVPANRNRNKKVALSLGRVLARRAIPSLRHRTMIQGLVLSRDATRIFKMSGRVGEGGRKAYFYKHQLLEAGHGPGAWFFWCLAPQGDPGAQGARPAAAGETTTGRAPTRTYNPAKRSRSRSALGRLLRTTAKRFRRLALITRAFRHHHPRRDR